MSSTLFWKPFLINIPAIDEKVLKVSQVNLLSYVLQMNVIIATIRESNLKLTLAFGIGIHHAGLHERDRKTVEELFVNCKIQVCLL